MIVLHTKENDEASKELARKLGELVVSYKVIIHDSGNQKLPFIEENGQEYREKAEIQDWLDELEWELNVQRSVSGDGCYINPKNGNIC